MAKKKNNATSVLPLNTPSTLETQASVAQPIVDKAVQTFTPSTYTASKSTQNLENDAKKYATYKQDSNSESYQKALDNLVNKGYDRSGDGANYKSNMNNVANQINDRKGFSYDLQNDALYQQYKNQYMNLGKQAMRDTTAQIASLNGGYGSSYATTAGNQAYLQQMTSLTDKIPELYEMAYNKYNQETQDLYNKQNMWSNMYNTNTSNYFNQANLLADRNSDYRNFAQTNQQNAFNNYNGLYQYDKNFGYQQVSDNNNMGYNYAQLGENAAQAYNKLLSGRYEYDNSLAYQTAKDFNDLQYQTSKDANDLELAYKQLAETIRSNKANEDISKKKAGSSGSSSGGSSKKGSENSSNSTASDTGDNKVKAKKPKNYN